MDGLTALKARVADAADAARRHSPTLARAARRARRRTGELARDVATTSRGLPRGTQTVLLTLYALALGVVLGLASADYATRGPYPFGGTRIGAWTVWPRAGSPDADPYIRAINARGGEIPLATGEGLRLVADADAAGRPLDPACTYDVAGRTPPARAWTLTVVPTAQDGTRRVAFTSTEVLREMDGTFRVALSPSVQPGNWLPTPDAPGRMRLVLRLYDTPAAANVGTLEPALVPAVTRRGCGA